MSGVNERYDALYGACHVVGATGSTDGPTGYRVGGITASARTGAGTYQLTLSPGCDKLKSQLTAIPLGAVADTSLDVDWTTDLLLNVTTLAAGVAADSDFQLAIRSVLAG